MQDGTKYLIVTRQEAELIMDSFKVSNPLTREIALKAAGMVLEWAAQDDVAAVAGMLHAEDSGPTLAS